MRRRNTIGGWLRDTRVQRRIGRAAACACGEARPFALISGRSPPLCFRCERLAHGREPYEDNHVFGKRNSPLMIRYPIGQPSGASMQAGDDMPGPANPPVEASRFLWAAANNVRHVDEWHASEHTFNEPHNAAEKSLRNKQKVSTEPLAAVFGHATPITENVAFEALQCLVATSESAGNYLQLELHLLRIGQDLIQRSGLSSAPIGVTVTAYHDRANLKNIPADDVVMSDGTMRAAASLPDVEWLDRVGPRSRPE